MRFLRKFIRELTLKWRKPERYLLERMIFPKIKNKKILLVGTANYTKDYPKRLNQNDLWSMDINPSMAKYGSKKHIIGDVVKIDKFFPKNHFDVILFIGIFGYGLNDKKQAEKTLENCAKVLKNQGKMIIQWSDISGHNQINPEKLENFKLFKRKEMYGFPPKIKTKESKIFEFLIKK